MQAEIMIMFIIIAVGFAIYYYFQARMHKDLYEDLQKHIDTYRTEIKALNIEVSYWKSKYSEISPNKKTVRKNRTK